MLKNVPKSLLKLSGWAICSALCIGVFLLYRWAASPLSPGSRIVPPSETNPPFVLKNSPFSAYENGYKTVSLRAERIEATRQPNAGLANVSNATLIKLRDGKIYAPHTKPKANLPGSVQTMVAGDTNSPSDRVTATFKAERGQYSQGNQFASPADVDPTTTVQWQFSLSGDVEFKTDAGEVFSSQNMIVYSLQKRGGVKPFLRIVCDEGAKIIRKKIELASNRVRFQPNDGVIECLGGVRGKFENGSVQTERAYWTLKTEMLRCPDTTSGQLRGMEFSAENMNLDIKNERATGTKGRFYPNPGTKLIPSFGLP